MKQCNSPDHNDSDLKQPCSETATCSQSPASLVSCYDKHQTEPSDFKELYAGLPQDLSSLPSFDPEDVPTGFINVGHKERDIVDEEGVSQSQDAEDEGQKAFPMSKPDGEVHFEMVPLADVPRS